MNSANPILALASGYPFTTASVTCARRWIRSLASLFTILKSSFPTIAPPTTRQRSWRSANNTTAGFGWCDSRETWEPSETSMPSFTKQRRVFQVGRARRCLPPNFLQSCVDVLDRHRDVVWCHCESDQIDQDGKSWLERLDPDKSDSIELVDGRRRWVGLPRKDHASSSPSQRFAGVLLGGTWAADSYGLVRADELRATRMLLPCYGAEKVLIGELALRGRYFHIPDQLFAQRIHDEASGNIRSSRFRPASPSVTNRKERLHPPDSHSCWDTLVPFAAPRYRARSELAACWLWHATCCNFTSGARSSLAP